MPGAGAQGGEGGRGGRACQIGGGPAAEPGPIPGSGNTGGADPHQEVHQEHGFVQEQAASHPAGGEDERERGKGAHCRRQGALCDHPGQGRQKEQDPFRGPGGGPGICAGEQYLSGYGVLCEQADPAAGDAHIRELRGEQGPALL